MEQFCETPKPLEKCELSLYGLKFNGYVWLSINRRLMINKASPSVLSQLRRAIRCVVAGDLPGRNRYRPFPLPSLELGLRAAPPSCQWFDNTWNFECHGDYFFSAFVFCSWPSELSGISCLELESSITYENYVWCWNPWRKTYCWFHI